MAEQSDRIKKEAKETAQVVEDAFRSISSKIGDYFEEALSKGEGVSKNMVRDVQSSLNSLSRVSRDIATNFEKANKGLLTQKNITKEIQERNVKLSVIQTQIEIAQRSGVGNIKQLNKEYEQVLKYNQEYERELQKQLKFSENLNTSIGLTGRTLSGISKLTSKIGLSGISDVFEKARDAAIEKAKALGVSETRSLGLIGKVRTMGAAFAVVGKEILKNLVDPLVLGGLAIKGLKASFDFLKAGYEEGKQAAERISDENTSIARSLGLAQGAATKLASRFAGIGPTVAASKQSIEAIYSALGSTEKLSDNTLKTFIKLNTFAGFSADALAKFQTFAKLSSQDAGTMVTNMANVALNSIKVNKLAISQKQLLTDVSNTSATIQIRFAKQPEALIKSVVAAKKLGLEMDQLEDIASSLLNFEDSIAAEMEAELLTGKQLNFEKARELALQGKTAEAAKLLVDQVGGIEEFNKLNVIQQEALAKTLGMNRQGFSEMLLAQEKNVNASGSLVDTQKDGMKAMMSGQSEAENNAERERRNQESQLKYYETAKQLVRDIKDAWIEIRGIIATSITDNLIKPFMAWYNSAGGQKFIKDTLPNAFRDAAKFVKDEIVPGIRDVVETLRKFIKENPNIAKAIAGGLAVEAGGRALTGKSVTGTVLSKGSDLLGNLLGKTKFGKFFGIGKNDGQSEAQALWVKITGAASSAVNSVTDMFTSKTKSPSGPIKDPKTGRFRDPTTGKFAKAPSAPSGGGGGGGGGFFSKIGSGLKNSSVGKFVSSAAGKAKNLAAKAINFANPMTYVKEYMPKIMGSKGFKKGISSLPKIGKIASLAMIAYDLFSQGKNISDASKAGVAPQDIGKQVVMALGDLGGSIIGGLLGTLIPIPGVGTMLGTFLGGLGGSALAGLIANNTDVSGIGNWMIGAFGNPKNAQKDVAEDFIMQGGKIQKFRKDDIVMGGTNLKAGSDTKTEALLKRLVLAVEKGSIIMLDGQKVGQTLSTNARRLQ